MRNKLFSNMENLKLQYVLAACLFLLLLIFGYNHAGKGIELTDEGLYVSAAMRYSMGDLPFRDEARTITNQATVLIGPLFHFFPDITLFHIRLLGLALHAGAYCLFFLLISRYVAPLLASLACSVMFLTNNFWGLSTISYNTLSSNFSLITLSIWIFALTADKKSSRLVLSMASGLFFAITVLSYSTMVALVVIPLVMLLASVLSEERSAWRLPSVTFIATFIIILSLAIAAVILSGLAPDFLLGLAQAPRVVDMAHGGLLRKFHAIARQLLIISPYGLALIFILYIARFMLTAKTTSAIRKVAGIIALILVAGILLAIAGRRASSLYYFPLVVVFFSLYLISGMLFYTYKYGLNIHDNTAWLLVRRVSLVWAVVSMVAYGYSSSTALMASVQGVTPLFVIGFISLYRIDPTTVSIVGISRSRWANVVIYFILISFLFSAAIYNYRSVYFLQDVTSQTAAFNHPRLKGIYGTPEQVDAIERLLDYLDEKVKPNDYFLAYNNIGMLYFLTHTRPAYGTVMASDSDWPISLSKYHVNKMIERDRIPMYCVRMMDCLFFPRYVEGSPLDVFVQNNYYLEKVIFPFEIWHRGPGPKYRIYEQLTPIFKSSCANWHNPAAPVTGSLSTEPSLTVFSAIGEFTFNKSEYHDGNAVRISPAMTEREKTYIRMGYAPGKNGLMPVNKPGSEIAVIISARVSASLKNASPLNTPKLFIEDRTNTTELNSVNIYSTQWDQYIVTRKLRDNATDIKVGIHWSPQRSKDWIEVRNIRIILL